MNYFSGRTDIENLASPIRASLIQTKTIVWNPEDGAFLFKVGHFGKPIGIKKPDVRSPSLDRPYELTLFESLYLQENNILEIYFKGEELNYQQFKSKCINESYSEFEDLYLVYKYLRDKKYILKPGLKFGSDFSVYRQGPGLDHSPFLIRIFPRNAKIVPLDLVSAGRLANSVKKRYLLASVISDTDIKFYEYKWTKP